MEIKRVFKKSKDGELMTDENDNVLLETIKVSRISKIQNFTQKFFDRSIREGFASMSKGLFTLHTVDGDLNYKIIRSPGYYCCFDNEILGGEKEARKYVAENFGDEISPDKNNPSGYRKDNFHACELQGAI